MDGRINNASAARRDRPPAQGSTAFAGPAFGVPRARFDENAAAIRVVVFFVYRRRYP